MNVYFQFLDTSYQEKIRTCSTPKEASVLGQNRNIDLCENWEEKKQIVMR